MMGKIVMPKNSALLEEVEAVLKIYYEADSWMSNDDYKKKLKSLIGDEQYSSSYTKKAQITSYFGFTEWEDITNVRSLRRITIRGKNFYEHIVSKNQEAIDEDLMISLEKTTFGRNNFGCPDSDTDVEPPVLFVRASFDLGYITYKEFAYLLWKLEDSGGNYTEAKAEIRQYRNKASFDIPEEAKKYTDAKPIMVLMRWGFLQEQESTDGVGGKHIVIANNVLSKFKNRIQNLKIYNIDKDIVETEKIQEERKFEMYSAQIERYESIPDTLTVDQLGKILSDMYNNSENKTTAIHLFGIKYGDVIRKNSYSAVSIVSKAGIEESYHVEVSKGIRIYESIMKNEYGVKFYDGKQKQNERQKTILPSLEKRQRTKFPLNSILYGAPGTGKTYATAQYALAVVEHKDLSKISSEDRPSLMSRYNTFLDEGQIVFTTFHQNYGYEDFIQGIRPDTSTKEMSFKTVDGVFKTISDNAMMHPEKDYVIIIDEINRANISKVFGELITLIENDKRWGEENAINVTLPSGENFAVPNNLYIIGTMNSADKSISLIDTALRRRFEFIEYIPNLSLISDEKLKTVLSKLNNGIANELNSTDLLIGHSFFMNKSANDLCNIMNHSVIPLLYEYFFDNQKKVESQIKNAIEGLDVEIKSSSMGRITIVKKVII